MTLGVVCDIQYQLIFVIETRHPNALQSLKALSQHFLFSHIPNPLPCRQEEKEKIYDYLNEYIQNRKPGTVSNDCFTVSNIQMLVSGPAGTGKTTVVQEVCKYIVKIHKNTIISTNCANLRIPQDVSKHNMRYVEHISFTLSGICCDCRCSRTRQCYE